MMKALICSSPGNGSALRIGELPIPQPKSHEIRIKTHFAGINYPDVLIIEDRYQLRPPRPFSPGIEIAGVIDAVGVDVDWAEAGQPCVALLRYGGLAEFAVAPAEAVAPIPGGLDIAEAASMVISHGTSWHALRDRANLRQGDTLLVLGASGVVGQAAVQLGKALGTRVVASVSSLEKARAAEANGADNVVLYPVGDVGDRQLATLFKEACGTEGATCIFDPVGGRYGEAALRALAWQGRYLVVGFASSLPNFAANLILLKSAELLGVSWGETVSRKPGMFRRHMAEIGELVENGAIDPKPTTIIPLEKAGDAIEALAARTAFGKTIVQIKQS